MWKTYRQRMENMQKTCRKNVETDKPSNPLPTHNLPSKNTCGKHVENIWKTCRTCRKHEKICEKMQKTCGQRQAK